jgi:hypothetical protein
MDDYAGDEMYPNDGMYFMPSEPQEKTERRRKARSKAKANENILQDVIDRLEKQVAFFQSNLSITDAVISDAALLQARIIANKETAINLQAEINYWKGVLNIPK